MAHNTRPLKRAQDGVAPQYYNPTTDEYEVLLGQDGAARAIVSGLENLATETKLEAVRTLVEDLKSELNLVKSELATIKANQLSGDQKVQVSGTFTELFGAHLSDRPPANSVSVGATFMVVGDTVVYQSNGSDWVVISE